VPKPAAKGSGTFSLFGSSPPAPKPVVTPPPPAPAAKKSPTFNLFGGAPPKKKAVAPVPEEPVKAPVKKASAFGGFSFGGSASPKPAAAKPVAAKKAAPVKKAPVKKAPVKKVAPVRKAIPGVPIVGKFKQNADGSITGIVRNSKNFKDGTRITTSPVKKGAKSGDLVVTSSGSKYQLD